MRTPIRYVLVAEVSFVSSWQGSGNLLRHCHSSGVSKESRHLVKDPQQRGTIHPPLGRVQPDSSGSPNSLCGRTSPADSLRCYHWILVSEWALSGLLLVDRFHHAILTDVKTF